MRLSEEKIKENVNAYFQSRLSFMVTEIMKLYTSTASKKIKLKCLDMLNKIGE